MTTLPTRSFATVVQSIASGVQGRASAVLTFVVGSTLRAIAEGVAGVLMWLQAMVLQTLAMSRASTSSGADLDSFVADFGLARLGAQAASGILTYSRFTAGPNAIFIPVGATVRTIDGATTFAVVADSSNPAFSAAQGGYTLPSSVASLNVSVVAAVAGAAGNIQPGTLTQMTSPIAGIDAATNGDAFVNGSDGETDDALRARFVSFILGLSRGDEWGLAYAIKALAVNVQWTLVENYAFGGGYAPGTYYVVADDGSGSPSDAFLAMVSGAVQSTRPLGMMATVHAPIVHDATISMTLGVAAGYDRGTVIAQVVALVSANVDSLGLGVGLEFGELYAWALSIAGVTKVTSLLLDGASGDDASIAASPKVTIKTTSVVVS